MRTSSKHELRRAEARHKNAQAALKKIHLSDGVDKPDGRALRQLLNSVPTGLYEHFKSSKDDQKFYIVLGVVPGVDGLHPPVVPYFALYKPHAGELVNRVMLGHVDAFLYPINRPSGKEPFKGARFKLVKNMRWHDAARVRIVAPRLSQRKSRAQFLEDFKNFHELLLSEP